jgi:hypothetical protein
MKRGSVDHVCIFCCSSHHFRRTAISKVPRGGRSADRQVWRKIAARGAKVDVLEGEHDTRPVVMFEFPNMAAVHAFWSSPDYVPIKKLREGIATINVWAFPGV